MYNTVLHKAKVWKRERESDSGSCYWLRDLRNSLLFSGRLQNWLLLLTSFLKFPCCDAHKLAADVTECQRRHCSKGVRMRGSTLSHGDQHQGIFNAAPVRAQLRSRTLLDPACAAVGPVWISGHKQKTGHTIYPPPSPCCLNCHHTQQRSSSAGTWPQPPCNLMIWNIAVVILWVLECSLHKNVWVAWRHVELQFATCARVRRLYKYVMFKEWQLLYSTTIHVFLSLSLSSRNHVCFSI